MEKRQREWSRKQKQQDKAQRRTARVAERQRRALEGGKDHDPNEMGPGVVERSLELNDIVAIADEWQTNPKDSESN
jgi:hypothetical protein